jgi:hypothetical protein
MAGIHFRQADLESREIGHNIGRLVWRRASALFQSGNDVRFSESLLLSAVSAQETAARATF